MNTINNAANDITGLLNNMQGMSTSAAGNAATDRGMAGMQGNGMTDPGEFNSSTNLSGMTPNELRTGVDSAQWNAARFGSAMSGSSMSGMNETIMQMMTEQSGQNMQNGGTGQSNSGSGAVGFGSSNCNGSTLGGGSSPQGGGSVGGPGMGVGPADGGGKDNGPTSTTPSGGSGDFKLGGTDVKIEGGTAEQRAKVEEKFIAMCENNPEFKEKIDAKAGSGVNVGFKEFGGDVAAVAEINGSNMWMDSSYMNGGSQGIAEVIAHEVGHLDGLNHGSELNNYSSRAAQSVA